jgi:hypothetical protein
MQPDKARAAIKVPQQHHADRFWLAILEGCPANQRRLENDKGHNRRDGARLGDVAIGAGSN